MESKFKKGDKVFDILFGWGEVIEINFSYTYPITVDFAGRNEAYTLGGALYLRRTPTLSFTEYTLEGFSQERPIELPEVGEEIMVSEDGYNWHLLAFSEFRKGCVYSKTGIAYKHFKRLR